MLTFLKGQNISAGNYSDTLNGQMAADSIRGI